MYILRLIITKVNNNCLIYNNILSLNIPFMDILSKMPFKKEKKTSDAIVDDVYLNLSIEWGENWRMPTLDKSI